jgi:prepilin-type N-terminal cleavage/methylation domain-containing protein
MKAKGFTLIELMICIAIAGILGSIAFSFFASKTDSNTTWGINGFTETRCINGYTFVVGQRGHLQQMIGTNGGGVPCN